MLSRAATTTDEFGALEVTENYMQNGDAQLRSGGWRVASPLLSLLIPGILNRRNRETLRQQLAPNLAK